MKVKRIVYFEYQYQGADLAEERNALGLNQSQFAEKAGLCQPNISGKSGYEAPNTRTVKEPTIRAFERAGIKIECVSEMIPVQLLEMADEINKTIARIRHKKSIESEVNLCDKL